jgi:hypothetical protein
MECLFVKLSALAEVAIGIDFVIAALGLRSPHGYEATELFHNE